MTGPSSRSNTTKELINRIERIQDAIWLIQDTMQSTQRLSFSTVLESNSGASAWEKTTDAVRLVGELCNEVRGRVCERVSETILFTVLFERRPLRFGEDDAKGEVGVTGLISEYRSSSLASRLINPISIDSSSSIIKNSSFRGGSGNSLWWGRWCGGGCGAQGTQPHALFTFSLAWSITTRPQHPLTINQYATKSFDTPTVCWIYCG